MLREHLTGKNRFLSGIAQITSPLPPPPHARKKKNFLQESFPYSFCYKSTFPHGATAAPSLPEAENIALENGGTSPGGSWPSTIFPDLICGVCSDSLFVQISRFEIGEDKPDLPTLVMTLPLAILVDVQ